MLLAIDPGKHKYGWALLHDNRIVDAGHSRSDSTPDGIIHNAKHIKRVVFEWPQVYPDQKRTDPNDLLDLTYTLGWIKASLEELECYVEPERVLPRNWKKQVPKEVHNRRALKRMTDDEKLIVGSNNNVIDAAALGIWAVGRW